MNRLQPEITGVCIDVGEERYIIVYDESCKSEALRTLGVWASHPALSFNWVHAAAVAAKIRRGE